jgi:hypothetical protein
MTVRIQFRRDTSTNWTFVNPILADGELGLETDTNLLKMGNGSDPWNAIPYRELAYQNERLASEILDEDGNRTQTEIVAEFDENYKTPASVVGASSQEETVLGTTYRRNTQSNWRPANTTTTASNNSSHGPFFHAGRVWVFVQDFANSTIRQVVALSVTLEDWLTGNTTESLHLTSGFPSARFVALDFIPGLLGRYNPNNINFFYHNGSFRCVLFNLDTTIIQNTPVADCFEFEMDAEGNVQDWRQVSLGNTSGLGAIGYSTTIGNNSASQGPDGSLWISRYTIYTGITSGTTVYAAVSAGVEKVDGRWRVAMQPQIIGLGIQERPNAEGSFDGTRTSAATSYHQVNVIIPDRTGDRIVFMNTRHSRIWNRSTQSWSAAIVYPSSQVINGSFNCWTMTEDNKAFFLNGDLLWYVDPAQASVNQVSASATPNGATVKASAILGKDGFIYLISTTGTTNGNVFVRRYNQDGTISASSLDTNTVLGWSTSAISTSQTVYPYTPPSVYDNDEFTGNLRVIIGNTTAPWAQAFNLGSGSSAPASNVVDGSTLSFWKNLATDPEPSLAVNLGQSRAVSAVQIFWDAAASTNISTFVIEGAPDGADPNSSGSYSLLGTFGSPDAGWNEYSLNRTDTFRYLRVRVTDFTQSSIGIGEIEFFEPSIWTHAHVNVTEV